MISVIAIDDEPLALQPVIDYILKTPGLKLLQGFGNPPEAAKFLSRNHVDPVLTDFQMPGLTGLDFTKSMVDGPVVIFTTAFDKYALDGFRLDVAEYLLKPFTYDEFLKSVHKAERMIRSGKKQAIEVLLNNEFLFLKSDYKIKRINFDDILYIEGLKEYVKVYNQNSPRPVLSLSTLKILETKLPSERIMRVHRSFIVNLQKIDIVDRGRIEFSKVYIPVGDQYRERFQKYLTRNFL